MVSLSSEGLLEHISNFFLYIFDHYHPEINSIYQDTFISLCNKKANPTKLTWSGVIYQIGQLGMKADVSELPEDSSFVLLTKLSLETMI